MEFNEKNSEENIKKRRNEYERKRIENNRMVYYLAIEPTNVVNFRSFCTFTLPKAYSDFRYNTLIQQTKRVDQRSKIAMSMFNQSNVKNFMSLSYYLNGPFPHKRALMREINIILKQLRADNTNKKKQMRLGIRDKTSELKNFGKKLKVDFDEALREKQFFPNFVAELKRFEERQKEIKTLESEYEYLKHCSREISLRANNGISSEEFFLKAGPPTDFFDSAFYQERWLETYLKDPKFVTIPF